MTEDARSSLPVEIVRSRRRRKTVQATIVDGVIRVQAPASMSKRELDEHVSYLVAQYPLAERARGFLMAISFGDTGVAEDVDGEAPEPNGELEWDEPEAVQELQAPDQIPEAGDNTDTPLTLF